MTSPSRQIPCRLLGGSGRATPVARPAMKLAYLLAPRRPRPAGTSRVLCA